MDREKESRRRRSILVVSWIGEGRQQHRNWKKAIEGKEDTEGAEKVEDNEVCAEKQAQEDAEVDTDEEEY